MSCYRFKEYVSSHPSTVVFVDGNHPGYIYFINKDEKDSFVNEMEAEGCCPYEVTNSPQLADMRFSFETMKFQCPKSLAFDGPWDILFSLYY